MNLRTKRDLFRGLSLFNYSLGFNFQKMLPDETSFYLQITKVERRRFLPARYYYVTVADVLLDEEIPLYLKKLIVSNLEYF